MTKERKMGEPGERGEPFQEGLEAISEDSNSPEQKKIYSNLSEHYEALFEARDDGNIVFVIGDKEIRAHEAIVAARCPPLKAMLESVFVEGVRKRIVVTIADENTFLEYLRFLYCGRINMSVENCSNLLPIAHHYLSSDLLAKCEKYLGRRINEKNVLDLFVKSEMHGAPTLADKCKKFILDNGSYLVETKEWSDFEAPNASLKNLLAVLLSPAKRRKLK